MNTSLPYIVITIGALLILAMLAYATLKSGRPKRVTPLTGLAFALVLASILFGEDRLIGYGLMAAGVILALIDIVKKSRGPVG
jgi:uncharacterized membrane protein